MTAGPQPPLVEMTAGDEAPWFQPPTHRSATGRVAGLAGRTKATRVHARFSMARRRRSDRRPHTGGVGDRPPPSPRDNANRRQRATARQTFHRRSGRAITAPHVQRLRRLPRWSSCRRARSSWARRRTSLTACRPEGPQRRVVIAKRFALGAYEVTVDQFAVFVAETGYAAGETCEAIDMAAAKPQMTTAPWHTVAATFRHPGFEVSESHPAVCVSWHDAKAYSAWLSRRTESPTAWRRRRNGNMPPARARGPASASATTTQRFANT